MERSKYTCEEIRERIDDASATRIERSIDESPVKEHLAECADCREYGRKAVALSRVLDEWRLPDPGESMAAAVMARIARHEIDLRRRSVGNCFTQWIAASIGHRVRVPTFAMAVFVAALGVSLAFNAVQIVRPPHGNATRDLVAEKSRMGGAMVQPVANVGYGPTTIARETVVPVTVNAGSAEAARALGQEAIERAFEAQRYFSTPMIVLILGVPPFQETASFDDAQKDNVHLAKNTKESRL